MSLSIQIADYSDAVLLGAEKENPPYSPDGVGMKEGMDSFLSQPRKRKPLEWEEYEELNKYYWR